MPLHLTLLIPDLVWSNPDHRDVYAILDASPLTRLLGRASAHCRPWQGADAWLAGRCGLAPAPLAALRSLGDGVAAGEHDWIAADPVHLRFHQERLVLGDASQLGLDAGEAAALVASLNEHFADAGLFVAAAPGRWALRLAQPVTQDWSPLAYAVGRQVRLAAMLADPLLKRLGNEAQMLLHAHPVNEARADAGRATVNALWFWGSGRLPATLAAPDCRICSNTPVARGLARLTGRPASAPPAGLDAWLAGAGDGETIVELDALAGPAAYGDAAAYLAAWAAIDRDWFAGLAAALRRGRIARLRVVAPSAAGLLELELDRWSAWRFWAPPTPWSTRARELADAALPAQP